MAKARIYKDVTEDPEYPWHSSCAAHQEPGSPSHQEVTDDDTVHCLCDSYYTFNYAIRWTTHLIAKGSK